MFIVLTGGCMQLIDLQNRDELGLQIDRAIRALKQTLETEYSSKGQDFIHSLLGCSAILTLEDSLYELAKNAIIHNATQLQIKIDSIDGSKIAIRVTDNGTTGGFSPDRLGEYPVSMESLPRSSHLGTQLGGANRGLFQAAFTLKRNEGRLLTENVVHSPTEGMRGIGASVIFISPIVCTSYRICDFQLELATARSNGTLISVDRRQQFSVTSPVPVLRPLATLRERRERLSTCAIKGGCTP